MYRYIIWTLLIATICAKKSYEGYKVYRLQPTNTDQLNLLSNLNEDNHFDFWTPMRHLGQEIDLMVDPKAEVQFLRLLQNVGLEYQILIKNVEKVIQQETIKQFLAPRSQNPRISFQKYNRFREINNYLMELSRDYSNIASVETIGKSYEGRLLNIIKISTNPKGNKPIIFIDAGIHAREWAAPAQAQYIIHQLVENKTNAFLLKNVDWHILPVMNPDGYEYTHTDERFWRKTRSPGRECYGTDANRNFDFHWGGMGTSTNECSDIYMGTVPFSEPETAAVRDYILRRKKNIKLYLTFHSYGKYLLYPWGYTNALPSDYAELHNLGDKVASKIRAVKGTAYEVGSSTNTLGVGAGGSDDWAKGIAGIQLSYTIELPGGGSWGFDPPPSSIMSIVTETWQGVMEFHRYIEAKFT